MVCSHVIVIGLSVCKVVPVPYVDAVTVTCVLLFVIMVRECNGAKVTAILLWGRGVCGCCECRA